MPEPSLSELSNINSDPERSGIAPVPVTDNSRTVEILNQNARFTAENTWRKWNKFLENKKELFKNIGEIQDLDVLPEDSPVLNKQMGDVLSEIFKNPSIVNGGQGYNELQSKIAQFKSNAMASKQDALDYKANNLFLDRTPELRTPENMAAMENEKKKPLGTRKSVMLQMPTIFDEKTAVEGLIKNSATEFDEVVGKDGKLGGEGYIAKIAEFDPEKFRGGWNMIVKGGQQDKNAHDLVLAVQDRYNKLPEREKAKYDAEGGIEKFWSDKGDQYLKAYFPDGKYRVIKDIKADPNYLGAERLELGKAELRQRAYTDQQQIDQGWARIGLEEGKLTNEDKEDKINAFSTINEAAGVLNNAERVNVVDDKGRKGYTLRISDPALLQKFGNVDKDGKVVNVPDFINFNPDTNQPILVYLKQDDKLIGKTRGVRYDREIPMDQRLWLKIIAGRTDPKNIGKVNNIIEEALKANNNSIYEISQKLKTQNQQQAAPAQTPAATQQYQIKGKPYTKADLINGGWTEAQFNEAVKSGKLK